MSDAARTKLASLGVLLVVFAAGAVLGAGLDRTLGAETPNGEEIVVTGDSTATEGEAPRRRQAMWERVEPSEAQRVEIDSILAHHRDRMESLQEEFSALYNPRYWSIVDATRNEIRGVFDEAQRARYDSLTTRYDSRARDRNRDDDASDETPDANSSGEDTAGGSAGNAPDTAAETGDTPREARRSNDRLADPAPVAESRPAAPWVDRWIEDARREGNQG